MVFAVHPTCGFKGVLALRPDEATLLNFFPLSIIERIKVSYLIIVHYCFYFRNQVPMDWVDLYLYPDDGVNWSIPPRHSINLSTRNFLNEDEFLDSSVDITPRPIDLIFVSNLSSIKNVDLWLKSLLKISENRPNIKSLSIIPIADRKLLKNCKLILSTYPKHIAHNHSVCFMERHDAAPLYPLSPKILQTHLANAKILVHFSVREGECRVITEALAKGCKIVAYKFFKGAALEPCSPDNSLLFENFDHAYLTIEKCLDSFDTYKPSIQALKNQYAKQYSVPRLVNYLKDNFSGVDYNYLVGELGKIDLKFALAGHSFTIPSFVEGRHYLGTLQDIHALHSYLGSVLKVNAPLYMPQLRHTIHSLVATIKRKVKFFLNIILHK